MAKVKNIESMQNIKVVYEEKDENSEDKGNKLILLDLRFHLGGWNVGKER